MDVSPFNPVPDLVTPATTPIVPVQSLPPSSSRTGKLVGILVVVLVLAVGSYYIIGRTSDEVVVVSPSPSVPESPRVSVSPTVVVSPNVSPTLTATHTTPAGWQTYSDAQLGFSFRYPTSWKLATGSYREVEGLKRIIKFAEVTPPNTTRIQSVFTIEQDYQNVASTRTDQVGKTETVITISGRTAYTYTSTSDPDIFIFIPSSSLHIKLHAPNAEMIQILATLSLN